MPILTPIDVRPGAFITERPGYYFGYGPESVLEIMEAVLDRTVIAQVGVTAAGQELAIQEIDQVPNVPADEFGDRSPQDILRAAWSEHTDAPFSSYVLRATDSPSSFVIGTLYEIDKYDIPRLEDWGLVLPAKPDPASGELVSRGWLSWNHDVKLTNGHTVETLTTAGQEAGKVVDGQSYNPFIIPRAIVEKVIQRFTADFNSRSK